MATVLDPEHGYRWLEKHPGLGVGKEALKNKIFGTVILFCFKYDLYFS